MLVGKASHPVAEAHIQLACQARTHLAKKVAVHNVVPKKDVYYKVFCDLDCLVCSTAASHSWQNQV